MQAPPASFFFFFGGRVWSARLGLGQIGFYGSREWKARRLGRLPLPAAHNRQLAPNAPRSPGFASVLEYASLHPQPLQDSGAPRSWKRLLCSSNSRVSRFTRAASWTRQLRRSNSSGKTRARAERWPDALEHTCPARARQRRPGARTGRLKRDGGRAIAWTPSSPSRAAFPLLATWASRIRRATCTTGTAARSARITRSRCSSASRAATYAWCRSRTMRRGGAGTTPSNRPITNTRGTSI